MLKSIKNKATLYLKNLPGWSTNRKIVVFISDDWGDLRIRNEDDYNQLLGKEIPVDKSPHTKYGCLADHNDLNSLYEVLTGVKDKNGRNAVFTPFTILANPDFEKIRNDNFSNYYYKVFTDTIKEYQDGLKTLDAWDVGQKENLFKPEFHGRDHLNIPLWLKFLRAGNKKLHFAFDHHYAYLKIPEMPVNPFFTFYYEQSEEWDFLNRSLHDGVALFKNTFGYAPLVFNPPNGMFHRSFYGTLSTLGVNTIQASHFRKEPNGKGGITKKYYYFGKHSAEGIMHYISNCAFEPVADSYKGIGDTLLQIKMAFAAEKPALINTHRVNYVGGRSIIIRDNSLKELESLLQKIKTLWNDVELYSAGEFDEILNTSKGTKN